MKTQKELMDYIYKYQRYIYDPSRRLFLFGRDRMLDLIALKGDEKVLEIGCGTARNLVEMLKTARNKAKNYAIQLFYTLAEEFDYDKHTNFDVVFFSYSLSMIPTWKRVLEDALSNLRPGGALYIVDFWDQRDLPAWFVYALRKWLDLFHVKCEPELLAYLQQLSLNKEIRLEIIPILKRYSYIAVVEKVVSPGVKK
jgi:S-adenosylmethionine-diacylgycerolhomoserine-N-methlytransferase